MSLAISVSIGGGAIDVA